MAIDRASLELWRMLKGRLPVRPAVLEIGQSNWYGDVDASTIPELAGVKIDDDLWRTARLFYSKVLDYSVIHAIDLQGTAEAWPFDLNRPIKLPDLYDVVINTGTTEHIFDQHQVFKSIHDQTTVGGVMVHAFPVAGCTEHGFYTYQPNAIRALAAANGYETLAELESQKGNDKILHLAWRKTDDRPFQTPQQNGYAGAMGGGGVVADDRLRPAKLLPSTETNMREQLTQELASLERQRPDALETLHRIDGAIQMVKHLLSKETVRSDASEQNVRDHARQLREAGERQRAGE